MASQSSRLGGGQHAINGPRAYIDESPTGQSVRLCGRYINLKRLADEEGLDHSYVCRIISGNRANPSSAYLKKVADALRMSIDDLVEAIAERKAERHAELVRRAS